MQTELRVINLGKRGGKVVRHFLVREGIFEHPLLPAAVWAYRHCYIDRMDLMGWLKWSGFSWPQIEVVLAAAERG